MTSLPHTENPSHRSAASKRIDLFRRRRLWLIGVAGAFCAAAVATAQEPSVPRYLDPKMPVEQRIDDLLGRMTVQEKVSQIYDSWGSQGVPRLHIPSMLKTEGLHSQSYSTGATLFPEPIAMASTFDTHLIEQVGKQTGVEAKAAHLMASWSPVLDVVRDVRWGRTEETYGESPFLVSRMGVAWIEGFQSLGLIAIPKHFAGHGEPVGGRDSQDYGLSERTMREIHLPSFRAAVEEAHAGGVMAAYGLWDGVPDNASTTLLQQVLRQEWGFDGIVVSDCGGLEHFLTKHAITDSQEEAAALAATAGVNMECGNIYRLAMEKAVAAGVVTEAQLDQVVRPTLRAKFRLGLFEHPEPDKMVWDKLPVYDTVASRELARTVEEEGAVLLRNEAALLPLKKTIRTIAVIGPNADFAQTGDYSPTPAANQLITVLAGIRSHVSPSTKVLYTPGLDRPDSNDKSKFAEAVATARKADAVVLVVGDNSRPNGGELTTGENRDGATLELPGAQRELVRAVAETGVPVVLVLVNGKPITLGWEAEHIPAILVTWYPGEEGGDATADLIFGDKNPSGHLPLTWPRTPAQLPLNYDYHPSGRRYSYYDLPFTPQYRFGFGLSYTQFEYSNLKVRPYADEPAHVTVTADVRNVGSKPGDAVAQLYLTDEIASVSTSVIEMQGMDRLSLRPGETKTATFDLTPYQLSVLGPDMVRRVEPGKFRVHVGGVSPDVQGDITEDRKEKVGFTNPQEGISGSFSENRPYAAHFVYGLDVLDHIESGQSFPVTVTVRNDGNLTDITETKLYSDVELGSWSFEVKPGEQKTHTFQVSMYKSGDLAMVAGRRMISRTVKVTPAPARLVLKDVRAVADKDGNIVVTTDAADLGSEPYSGELALKIDGARQETQSFTLLPGETRKFILRHQMDFGGIHRVQLNDEAEREVNVPAGVGLAVRAAAIDLEFSEGKGSTTRNQANGAVLQFCGTPAWVQGKDGTGIRPSSGSFVEAGNLQLYRQSFTLSAWIKIDQLASGNELGLFGGKAPMGADQDSAGTVLNAGIRNKKLFLSFQDRELTGSRDIPLGSWIQVAYVYDAAGKVGSLYINGNLDKTGKLDSYTGPLESIGDAPTLRHGNYSLDDVFVVENALSLPLIQTLYHGKPKALTHGTYTSAWKTVAGKFDEVTVVAERPAGTVLEITIESRNGSGEISTSKTIEASDGRRTYKLEGISAGDAVRVRAEFHASARGVSPTLRAVSLEAGVGPPVADWSKPQDWTSGAADKSLSLNEAK